MALIICPSETKLPIGRSGLPPSPTARGLNFTHLSQLFLNVEANVIWPADPVVMLIQLLGLASVAVEKEEHIEANETVAMILIIFAFILISPYKYQLFIINKRQRRITGDK